MWLWWGCRWDVGTFLGQRKSDKKLYIRGATTQLQGRIALLLLHIPYQLRSSVLGRDFSSPVQLDLTLMAPSAPPFRHEA